MLLIIFNKYFLIMIMQGNRSVFRFVFRFVSIYIYLSNISVVIRKLAKSIKLGGDINGL